MFPLRFVFLIMVISMIWSNCALGGESNDRIDTLLSLMITMGKRIDKLTETEEMTVDKVLKIEDEVQRMEKRFNQKMDSNNKEVKSKMEKIDADVKSERYPFGWKYYGRGLHGSGRTDFITKHDTSFIQCVDMCEHKHVTDGKEWNGMEWQAYDNFCVCSKNDDGHNPWKPSYIHFKRE